MSKRRGTSPLLEPDMPRPDYLVDTSSWIALNERPDIETVWPIIEALIIAERLFSPGLVINEVVSARELIQPYIDVLRQCDRNDAEFLLTAGRIARKYRRLAKPDGRKTKADPFIIALAKLDGYTVVAEESLKRSFGKLPGVCDREQLKCVCLAKMLEAEREFQP
jgi:predicted nucleic acid-binding protein